MTTLPPLWALEGHAFESPGFPEVLEYTIDYLSVLVVNPEPPPLALLHGAVWEEGSKPLPYTRYDQVYEQSYRVADDSYDVYELYVGEGSAPDFDDSAQPVSSAATLAGLSYSPTPPGTGDTLDLYIVVRKRNKYNLHSFNVLSYVLTIDSGGAEVTPDPSAPIDVVVYEGSDNTEVLVVAKYVNTDDGANAADKWEVYISNGVDPVPGTDAPVYEADMEFFGEEAGLTTTIELDSSIVAGDTIHVTVTALRDSDSARGNAAAVQYTIATDLEIVESELFGGDVYIKRGVDSAFEYSDISGLATWLDPSDDTYLTGTPVTQWDARVGSASLALSFGTINRGTINGRQCLTSTATWVLFDNAYPDLSAWEPFYGIIVVQWGTSTTQRPFRISYSGDITNTHYRLDLTGAGGAQAFLLKNNVNATKALVTGLSAHGSLMLVEFRATDDDDRGLRLDGNVTESTNAVSEADGAGAPDRLEIPQTGGADMKVGDFVIYNRIPEPGERIQIRQKAVERWGVTGYTP